MRVLELRAESGALHLQGLFEAIACDLFGVLITAEGVGPADGSYRVLRGGSSYYSANYARSAIRDWNGPAYSSNNLGFRLSLRSASKQVAE